MIRNMTFGERMRMLRAEKGLSQSEMAVDFAQRMGQIITKSGISYYEADKRIPEAKTLIALAEYFDVSIDFLMARTDQRKETVPASPGFSPNDVLYKNIGDVLRRFHQMLVERNIIKESDPIPADALSIMLTFGEPGIQLLKSQGIDIKKLAEDEWSKAK